MNKLELNDRSFPYIFSSGEVTNIILDKENKIFQVIFRDCPMLEMFLREKLKYNTICFYAQGWDNVTITLNDEKKQNITEIDKIEKTRLLIIKRTSLKKPIFGKKTIFHGYIYGTGNSIEITFKFLKTHDFYEMEKAWKP